MATLLDSVVRPTINISPDSRFATTFLSTKYRDRAIAGEVIMDKISGEIFIKRAIDGKIVSFYQNKKSIDELMSEFSVIRANNLAFNYPNTNPDALYVSTNYDLAAINNESLFNILTENITITGTPSEINKLTFNVSSGSNGFFCNHTTRTSDVLFVDVMTRYYDAMFRQYSGTDMKYLAEYSKFISNPKWESSNAVITYDVSIFKNDTTYLYSDNVDYITLNTQSFIKFPENIYSEVGTFDYATVTIKSITYDKIHFMINNKDTLGNEFIEIYNKFISVDNRVEVAEFNVIYFINNINELNILGNETDIHTVDIKHVNSYLDASDNFILEISNTQPNHSCLWFSPKE